MPIIHVDDILERKEKNDKKSIIDENLKIENYKHAARQRQRPIKIKFNKAKRNFAAQCIESNKMAKIINDKENDSDDEELQIVVKGFSKDILKYPMKVDKRESFSQKINNSKIINKYLDNNLSQFSDLCINSNYKFLGTYMYYYINTILE